MLILSSPFSVRENLRHASVILSLALLGPNATAVVLNPGDILVGDQRIGGTSTVIHVNPATGNKTTVSGGGFLSSPFGIQLDQNGQIVVSDTPGGLIRINPLTGVQTLIPNTISHFTRSLIIDGNSDLLVGGLSTSAGGAISRVDPSTGVTTLISTGGLLNDNMGIARNNNGALIVGNFFGSGGAGVSPLIVRIDPETGAQTTVSLGDILQEVGGLLVDPAGMIVAVGNIFRGSSPGLYTIDMETGNQTLLSSGGWFDAPFGVTLDLNGDYVVADRGTDSIFRVDQVTGNQTLISSGFPLVDPVSLVVVPEPALSGGALPNSSSVTGTPLFIEHAPGDDITLVWDTSCLSTDDDFAVYEGPIGDFTNHAPRFCSTGGATSFTLSPASEDSYYLVVPQNRTREGSYGRSGNGEERPQGKSACQFQQVGACP